MPDDGSLTIRSVVLDKVIGVSSGAFVTALPEYAFVGRSNVGKSSLINMLLRNKKLARVSASPGKTRTINYYRVNDEFYLVDLPGYGYARVSEREKAEIAKLADRYLYNTVTLRKIFLLVDMRHKPTGDDILMHEWILSRGYTSVIIATKADKLGKNDRLKALRLIRETLGLGDDDTVIPASSATGAGRDEILLSLA